MVIEQMIIEVLRQSYNDELSKAFNAIGAYTNDRLIAAIPKEEIHQHYSKQASVLKNNWNIIQDICERTNIDGSKLYESLT